MFTQKSLAAAAAIALLSVGAFAGEFSATAGFEASVDFDSDFDSTGDAVELSLGGEYTAGGFFAGLTFTFAEAGGVDELETGTTSIEPGVPTAERPAWLAAAWIRTGEVSESVLIADSDVVE